VFEVTRYPEGAILDEGERLQYINARAESPIEHRLAWSLLQSFKFVIVPSERVEEELPRHKIGFVMQHPIGPYRLDMALFVRPCAGGLQKIAVECDGEKYHGTPLAQRRDQIRDAYLYRQGFTVWRYAGWMLHHAADAAADEIQRAAEDIQKGLDPILTFSLNRKDKRPTLAEYEAAYWVFDFGGPWPARMGKNPKQRGWRYIEDLFDWARHDAPHLFPELEDDE
jgi:very-short-patch-repair endonuclease